MLRAKLVNVEELFQREEGKRGCSESETSFGLLFSFVRSRRWLCVLRKSWVGEGWGGKCPHPDYYRLPARGKFSHSEDIISVGKFSEPGPRLGVM